MVWQEVEGTNPPLEFNENENIEVPPEVLKEEEQSLAQEITGDSLSREQGESLGSKFGESETGNEVIFDSKVGYSGKTEE